jgi:hypothetical protein
MLTQNLRRQLRNAVNEQVRVSWQDPAHGLVYQRGKCVDVSDTGMRIKMALPIPLQSMVSILSDGMGFAGNGSVRHVERKGSYYLVGLQLSQTIASDGARKS